MKLLIKQRVFSWTDTYDVYDEEGNTKYFVKAEFLALGHQIHVYDRYDNEVGMVKQKLLTFLPAFDIEIGGSPFGRIQKEFTFFKPRYELDYNGWRCEGDFMAWNYDVYSGCSAVVHISKENHRVIKQRLTTVLMCVRVNKSELLSCKQERVLTF